MKRLSDGVEVFVERTSKYYLKEFDKIQRAKKLPFSWNWSAFAFGPLWGAWRRMWGFFWTFMVLELFALIQISRGLWSEAGGSTRTRYEQIVANISKRQEELKKLIENGDQVAIDNSSQVLAGLERVAMKLQQQLAQENLNDVFIMGLVGLLGVKILEGLYANIAYEKEYLHWRIRPLKKLKGCSYGDLGLGLLFCLLIWPITIFRFTVRQPDIFGKNLLITEFPIQKQIFNPISVFCDRIFDWMALYFGDVFNGITRAINFLVSILETLLIGTPWPVVIVVCGVVAFRMAGRKVAIFAIAAMLYLAFMGLWEASMITVALIGAGTALCLVFGIPLGIYLGRSSKAQAIAWPILDFMQTMPAFVYLIPIIAFFGTGKPPGVLATIIFAMPPVVRLTALGIRNVPDTTKEAAIAFGCSDWQLLRHVEVPLAMPSIMTGINQTIMMGLSMVVLASLIGAEGLGALILEALQYAAKGQGLLAGLAILLCAMVIDRTIQGHYKRTLKEKGLNADS